MNSQVAQMPSNENTDEDIERKYVPEIDDNYVRWGHFDAIRKVIESEKYYPIWVTGLSGNGKTQMIEQACAAANLPAEFFAPEEGTVEQRMAQKEKKYQMLEDMKGQYGREFIRVNFTVETDENQLIGGFRLVDGDTQFQEGPIVEALRRGAILLLDEIDVGHTNKIMCLQSVLEGKGVLIKATGEYVKPAKGFNVFATSNTKGRGSEDGKFIGTNIMNAAFLDRFGGMIHQKYPDKDIEEAILKRYFYSYNWQHLDDASTITKEAQNDAQIFIRKLTDWAEIVRKAYENGATQEVITTRTLINVIQAFSIFNDKMQSIRLACERYDDAVRENFLDFYTKVDETVYREASEIVDEDGVIVSEDEEHLTYKAS